MEKTNNGLYLYWSAKQRIAHVALFFCAIVAILTGLPLKYYDYSFAKSTFDLFGGYEALTLIHDAAGMAIVGIVLFHFGTIIYIWIRSEHFFKLIEMKFTKDDIKDFRDAFLYFLGVKNKPEFGRYTLFEKIDYFAMLMCLFLLLLTGIVILFPIAITSLASISWLTISRELHSSISVLFIVFVAMSHLFNTHIHHDKLYFNSVWIFGALDEDKMKATHYKEYKRILAEEVAIREEYKRKSEEISKESMVKKEKKMLEDYLKEGNDLVQNKNYDQAIEKYKEAIKIYPNYSQARFNLGVAHKRNGQYQQAISAFDEFIQMDPFNKMVDVAKANLKELTQLVKESEKESDKK